MLRREVRPHEVAEVEFGIGKLPHEEITHALLVARANKQVRVAEGRGAKLSAKLLLRYIVRLCAIPLHKAPRRVENVPSAPIVKRQDKVRFRTGSRCRSSMRNSVLNGWRELVELANRMNAHAALLEDVCILVKNFRESGHHRVDLISVTLPILRREEEGSDVANIPGSSSADVLNEDRSSDFIGVEEDHLLLSRPAAVAINDESNMIWMHVTH